MSDEDVIHYERLQQKDKEYVHGQLAIEAARLKGIFADVDDNWEIEDEAAVDVATGDVESILDAWHSELEWSSLTFDESISDSDEGRAHHFQEPMIAAISALHNFKKPANPGEIVDEGIEHLMGMNVDELNTDQ